MNYVFGMMSILLGIYTLPMMISVIEGKFELPKNRMVYWISSFLLITFPLVNFANSIDMIFLETYKVCYLCGIYGFMFILFSFFISSKEVIRDEK